MLRLCILVALLSVCFGAVTLEERVASITAEAPSFHSLILKNSAFKLARNRAINTVISKRRKAIINALSLPQALNKKSESADDILHLDDDFFNLDDLIPTFDDDTFSFDDDIFNIDDQFDFDDAFTFDDDYFSFDDDFWSFDDDTFSFDDDMWSFDDDTAYSSVDGYVSYAFTYGDTCSGTKTMEVGVVAGTCFSDYVASYMLQFSDATCNGLRVSFYEDTSCSSLLYTIPIDGFTDCMMVPMANGTFYSSAQGMCSPGYTVSVDMNSVLLTVFENTETCAGVPVVYAAVATDVCLTVDDEESYELSCDAEFDIFSGTNYTSSGSCAAGSSGQQDFLFPLLCYDSSELSDLPISTYAMHHGHVGTPQRQPEDRTMVKTQRSVKRIHSAGGQPTVVKHQTRSSGDVSLLLRGKNSRKVSRVPLKIQTSSKQVRKDVYQRNKQRHLNSILNGNKQNKKQKKQQQKKPNKLVKALTKAGAKSRPVDVKRSHFHLRGGPRVASADDILHLDDDFIHIDDGLFSDDLFPSFDDDLFSLDDDIFDGFDDAITFDDDFWSFDDQEFSLDDDFWSFDDDLFSFDDNADDDWYSSAVFSFDIKCGTTSNPITYTPLPTVMPTGMPVAPPTMGPTAMPSQSVPAYVSFDVTQMLYGMSYDTYQSNADLYASTLIDSIAECMTGVTSDNIDSFNAAAGSRRLLQVLFFEIADSSSDSLILTYTVTVDSSYDYEALSNELQSNIASGQFDSYLQTNAQANDAPALTTCYSDTASTTQTNTNSITDDNSSGGGSGGLSDGAIVGVVIAVLVLVTVAYYLWARKSLSSGKSSAGDDRSVSSDSTNESTAAAATPKGPASEFVTLKDIQLKTAPVYGITTISNEKGNATDAHDSL